MITFTWMTRKFFVIGAVTPARQPAANDPSA